MKNLFLSILMLLLNCGIMYSQVSVTSDGSAPDNSAMFDVKSTDKGILIPRLTYDQRNAISTPAEGLIIFCTDCGGDGSLSIYSNGTWKTFSPCSSASPVAGVNSISSGQIIWNWNPVSGATGYKWSTSNNFSAALDMGTICSKTETCSTCDTAYTRFIWSYNSCAISAATTLSETLPDIAIPASPTAGTHLPSVNQIVWNWNTVAGASGYKWNTMDEYGSAEDMGAGTTKTESALNCGTSYTRYVWANNGCGHSASTSLMQSTIACCGDPFNVDHLVSGGAAPVDKSTTYGTVTNVPGESSKCWITSNLGSDNQATSVDDASEASAGWYWQFNRLQGYMHDGVDRTPNTTWIINIDENSDWTSANDPCPHELGGGWRIPTYTEWYNVDAGGNWTDWNHAYNSVLKIHGAGILDYSSGTLSSRGSFGVYWSSSQLGNTDGKYLILVSGGSEMGSITKSYAFPLRCLRN